MALGDLLPEMTGVTQQQMPLRELLLLAYQRAPKLSRGRPDIEEIPTMPEHAGEVVSKAC
jgi:hypothetical protein